MLAWLALAAAATSPAFSASPAARVVVGSKIFTEGYILGEIAAQAIEAHTASKVTRRLGMGSTGILFESLRTGAIDVYADYTGTLSEAILKNPELKTLEEIQRGLTPLGMMISKPLGFDDTYALALRKEYARKHGLRTISDLHRIAGTVRAGFSYEFMDRADGFPGMQARYQLELPSVHVRRMAHSLIYRAIADGAVDVIEVYSTDAKIKQLNLQLLEDDRHYFPAYQAVWVATRAFTERDPQAWRALQSIEGRIDRARMIDMNAAADIERKSFAEIAAAFIGPSADAASAPQRSAFAERTIEHLRLVGAALLFSLVIGVPLGITAARYPVAGQGILLFSAIVQTIPSLALLCFLIPAFGVGTQPALAALCLYSLLPVVLNTFTGIRAVDARHVENARAFGLSRRQILWRIVLPLASPTLLAGLKTATIVSIGTATLAALVGAGGYGAPIVSGLALNDTATILTGAVPAAGMALLAHGLFELLGRWVIPAGIRRQETAP